MTTGPTGPFLYDDEPAPLHTGTPRRRQGLLLAVFGGTVVLAVLMVVALPLFKGSAEDQAREAAGVFLSALNQGDTETAHQLLCDAERARLAQDEVEAAYAGEGVGEVEGAEETTVDGEPAQRVLVGWADGATTELVVVNEGGPHICGTD
jgi:hypothetical protein